MKYKKEELEKLILAEKLSYREIGRMYGVSDVYIKKVSKKLGIQLPKRKKFPNNFVPHNKGKGVKIYCKNCGKLIENPSWVKQIFCNSKCYVEYRVNSKYQDYLENQEDYCGNINAMRFTKLHILKEQYSVCSICGNPDEWNGKKLVFILDHIDGDASNNLRENLRLVCPNCDSQLDTYKSKNKNSARKERYLKNYKN